MGVERCDECGFNGDDWTDRAAVDEIAGLPEAWQSATAGLRQDETTRRLLPATWSIAEYVDHVREVLFGMRFVLDSAIAHPGVDLGAAPEPVFAPEVRSIDLHAALDGLGREARSLHHRLVEIPPNAWDHTATVGEDEVDAHWVCRHAVHDARHHLMDVERLRALRAGC